MDKQVRLGLDTMMANTKETVKMWVRGEVDTAYLKRQLDQRQQHLHGAGMVLGGDGMLEVHRLSVLVTDFYRSLG